MRVTTLMTYELNRIDQHLKKVLGKNRNLTDKMVVPVEFKKYVKVIMSRHGYVPLFYNQSGYWVCVQGVYLFDKS